MSLPRIPLLKSWDVMVCGGEGVDQALQVEPSDGRDAAQQEVSC